MKLAIGISGICLGTSLLFNSSIAQETTPVPVSLDKAATPEVATTSPPSGQTLSLETTVDNYMNAWKNQDFKTMRSHENWDGGKELGEVQYIQSFNPDFRVNDWEISRMIPIDNDEYQVTMLIRHTPPKPVAAFFPAGRMVNTTRPQWWKKQGDKFVHLFHIERQKFFKILFPTSLSPAASASK